MPCSLNCDILSIIFMFSQNESQIFPPTTGGAEKMCQNLNVSLLGKVPLDPQIGKVAIALCLKQVFFFLY